MDYCGIANVERLSGAPQGNRPTDLLPGAKSVVVMAVKLSLGAVQTIFRAHEDGLRHAMCIYGYLRLFAVSQLLFKVRRL